MRKVRNVFDVISTKELIIVYALLFLIISSSLYLCFSYYIKNTIETADYGGEYIEGAVGQPRFINPILSQTNDIDSDLSSLVYSGLMKLDSEGNLIKDIAESYDISEDGLVYTFRIKHRIKWHDGVEFTSDDIVYTIKTIQNSDFNSRLITNWNGVRVEKIDKYTVKFILKNAYSPFLNNLTVGILPKHIWEFIGAGNFLLAEYNIKPIGAGPYKFKQFVKDKEGNISSIELEANEDYYTKRPFVKKLVFKFFQSEKDAISAFNRKEINGISYLSPKYKKKIVDFENSNVYRLSAPRYFAVFFNQTKSKALSNKTVRLALAYATNKSKLIKEIIDNEGIPIETPIPPQLLGYNPNTKIYDYAREHANNILEANGWIDSDGDGVREKNGIKMEFVLVYYDNAELYKIAKMLKDMWKEIGANVEIKSVDVADFEDDYVKPHNYEAILIGEILNYDPDPFSFWHSSQKKESGLNLSLYDNPEVDKILEEARREADENIRAEKYKKFQEIVVDDVPAVFLYSPNYLYIHDKSIKGVKIKNIVIPSDRFNNIENWYVKTKRVWR